MSRSIADVDTKELEEFIANHERLMKKLPEAKRTALRAAGEAMRTEVQHEILSQGIHDDRGKVRSWQEVVMGSKGGYTRVQPMAVPVTNRYGKSYGYNSAQVTYCLNHGHAVPQPSGKQKRYKFRGDDSKLVVNLRSKRGSPYIVPGRQFYGWAQMNAREIGLEAFKEEFNKWIEEYNEGLQRC